MLIVKKIDYISMLFIHINTIYTFMDLIKSDVFENHQDYKQILELDKDNIIQTSINITKNIDIKPSNIQTKDWRKEQEWYINGKKNECEIYQRNKVQEIIGKNIIKTNKRFNKEKNTFEDISNPNVRDDGFEWTEDMDGECIYSGIKHYYNFKMICDKGGAQTRTLREVYDFIRAQFNWLIENTEEPVIFINILDGDESFRHKNKFDYLKNNKKYESIKDKIFIGDLYEFQQNYNS